jgi:hypothetical protein
MVCRTRHIIYTAGVLILTFGLMFSLTLWVVYWDYSDMGTCSILSQTSIIQDYKCVATCSNICSIQTLIIAFNGQKVRNDDVVRAKLALVFRDWSSFECRKRENVNDLYAYQVEFKKKLFTGRTTECYFRTYWNGLWTNVRYYDAYFDRGNFVRSKPTRWLLVYIALGIGTCLLVGLLLEYIYERFCKPAYMPVVAECPMATL